MAELGPLGHSPAIAAVREPAAELGVFLLRAGARRHRRRIRSAVLASLGCARPGPHPPRAVAEGLGSTTPGVGALRDRLITDGVIYSPAYGQVAFALLLLDDYLRRNET